MSVLDVREKEIRGGVGDVRKRKKNFDWIWGRQLHRFKLLSLSSERASGSKEGK